MIATRTLSLLFTGVFLCGNMHAQNLIQNGGFETATVPVPTGTPIPFYPTELDHWTATDTDGEFVYGPTQAHSGNGFMSMLDNGGQNPGTPWLGAPGGAGFDRAGQVVDVQPNTDYELIYWYRAGDGSRYGYGAGNTLVQVEEIAPTFSSIVQETLPATATWQLDTIAFSTGNATAQIIVLFSSPGPNTTDTWYDDVQLYLEHPITKGIEELFANVHWTVDQRVDQLRADGLRPGYTITVYNALGQQVTLPVNCTTDRTTIDLAGLADGAFVAVISDGKARMGHSFVLAR